MQNTDATLLLEGKCLTCIKQDRVLFEDLNIAIHRGDIIQVAGPNGAGKTSLLRILAGLSQPYDGEIHFDQKNIHQDPDAYHQALFYLGHQTGVKAELTAQENLEFNLALHGQNPSNAEQLLEDVGLIAFEDTLAAQLSAGQQRRIALAQLWNSSADIWILDEPFTAIDAKGVQSIEQKIKQHVENGGAVILTTHQDLSLPVETIKRFELTYRF